MFYLKKIIASIIIDKDISIIYIQSISIILYLLLLIVGGIIYPSLLAGGFAPRPLAGATPPGWERYQISRF